MKKLMMMMMIVILVAGLQGCAGGLIGMGGLLDVEQELSAADSWTQVPRASSVWKRCTITPYNFRYAKNLTERIHVKRRRLYVRKHSELSDERSQLIMEGLWTGGMSRNEFRASVGHPRRTNHSSGSWGTSTQFVYRSGSLMSCYYFKNDRYTGSN